MRRPMLLALGAALALAVTFVAAACGGAGESPPSPAEVESHGVRIEPPVPMPSFTLTGVDGEPVSTEDHRGRVLAVFFGYTHCPDVCPMTLATLKEVSARLSPEEREQFAVLMVAVDPERDTPEVLGRYLDLFDPAFEGATGDPAEVEPILASWGIAVDRGPVTSGGYTVSHPASIYFLDRTGRWVLTSHYEQTIDQVTEDVRHLIAAPVAETRDVAPPPATSTRALTDVADEEPRWFFALADGSVVERTDGGEVVDVLPPWSVQPSEDDLARRQYPGARELAYDAAADTLWFADTHEAIHSIHLDGGAPGVSIEGFADAALPGCGVADLSREFALLPGGLIVPTLLGTTLVYDSTTGAMLNAFDPGAFGGPLLGQFRLFVTAADRTTAWYVDASGVLHEMDLETWSETGRSVGPLSGAPDDAFLEAALNPADGLLYYLTTDGHLGAWDIDADTAVEPPFEVPEGTRALAVG